MSYAPNFASERLLPGPPFRGCGLSADWVATDLATLGESSRRPDGQLKGTPWRRGDLQRGWKAFKKVPDSNGIPDTGDAIRIHRAMFPDLPDMEQLSTRDWRDVVSALDDKMAVSIAVRLSALPAASSMRQYTSADHQVVLYGRKRGTTTRVDPMHQQSNRYSGDTVDLGDVRAAAEAIENGLILAWVYPIEGWTAEELLWDRLQRRIRNIKDRAAETEQALEARIRALEQAQPVNCKPLVDNARAATTEKEMVELIAWADGRRIGIVQT